MTKENVHNIDSVLNEISGTLAMQILLRRLSDGGTIEIPSLGIEIGGGQVSLLPRKPSLFELGEQARGEYPAPSEDMMQGARTDYDRVNANERLAKAESEIKRLHHLVAVVLEDAKTTRENFFFLVECIDRAQAIGRAALGPTGEAGRQAIAQILNELDGGA